MVKKIAVQLGLMLWPTGVDLDLEIRGPAVLFCLFCQLFFYLWFVLFLYPEYMYYKGEYRALPPRSATGNHVRESCNMANRPLDWPASYESSSTTVLFQKKQMWTHLWVFLHSLDVMSVHHRAMYNSSSFASTQDMYMWYEEASPRQVSPKNTIQWSPWTKTLHLESHTP